MSTGSPTAADVPGIFDIIIGQSGGTLRGYMFARQVDPNIPFRTQRAKYGYTKTFLERQNVTGDYGDDQQAFWLTAAMRDWSLGEDSKYYRSNDAEKARQYWIGSNVDVTIPGQIGMMAVPRTLTFAAAAHGSSAVPGSSVAYTVSSTNLYEISALGAVTDRGAHGVGGSVTGFATDGTYLYLSGSAGTKVRKWDVVGHTFSDFSTTQPADNLIYLNNTLYGTNQNVLYSYDTAGTATAAFTFKRAEGGALTGTMQMEALGGKIILLRKNGSTNGAELWEYDGTGVAKLCEFPGNFVAYDICVVSGIVWVVGNEQKGYGVRTAVWYYANGNIGRAYVGQSYGSASFTPSCTPFGSGFLFGDAANNAIRFYDLNTGGTSTQYTISASGTTTMATSDTFAILVAQNTTGYLFFNTTAAGSSSFFQTSIVDMESSLTKLFRGVTVDFVLDTNGNGGTVDVAYQIDSVTGAYTSLATGITSGTEVVFPAAVTGRGISWKITLNKGTSTFGPVVKRIYTRAAPRLQQFRTAEYILDLTGANGKVPVQLRNGLDHPKDGQAQAISLFADATSGALLTITDRFGTYTGIIELDTLDMVEVSPEEYFARFQARQV